MNIKLPEKVKYIIQELEKAGYEAYAVGGCVRDSLIGRIPEDWDITTSALPSEVKELFKYTVDTGIEHGTVTVKVKSTDEKGSNVIDAFEVTTYRVDGEYEDMRHPKSVSFTRSLEEDLKRRDFTINAMAYSDKGGLVDLFGGREDLDKHVIRCVGRPEDRFEEDALRMLRAVRFAAQLEFSIDEATKEAICSHAENLHAISKERVFTEISKLICSANIEKIYVINELGLSEYVASGFKDAVYKELDKLLDRAVLLPEKYLRYAFLFAGQSEETVKRILRELKADNDTVHKAGLLASRVFASLPEDRYALKVKMAEMSPKLFENLLEMKKIFENSHRGENCRSMDRIIKLHKDIIEKNDPVYIKDLAVTGADLIKAGIRQGPEIGEMLEKLIDTVRKKPELNTKEILLSEIKNKQKKES